MTKEEFLVKTAALVKEKTGVAPIEVQLHEAGERALVEIKVSSPEFSRAVEGSHLFAAELTSGARAVSSAAKIAFEIIE